MRANFMRLISNFLPVIQPTSAVDRFFCCKNRFGVSPGKCFSNVDCVSGLNGLRAPHDDADNIECSFERKSHIINSIIQFNCFKT